jgi:hypothetical protein
MSFDFTLTDVARDLWLDQFSIGPQVVPVALPHAWSVRKRTLRGGLRDGVDVIDVDNGALTFSVLPTRGLGLWRGSYRGVGLGWQAPVLGPVHPKFVNLSDRNGLGWLTGFDEWVCRCGLNWNGAPGPDGGWPLTLHGRIANQPAHLVSVAVDAGPPATISVSGQVEEGGLFYPRLRLTTTYVTEFGSNRLTVHDRVETLNGTPTEVQVLYHINLGPPLLGEGGGVALPLRQLAPLTTRAAEGIDTWSTYLPPTTGYTEQVYACTPLADDGGNSLALLHDSAGERGLAVRWRVEQLPCFTIWKNTAAVADGYVTGLEPATNFPNNRSFERTQGRVIVLPPGGSWEARWCMEVFDSAVGVGGAKDEIARLQSRTKAVIHRTPQHTISPV